MSDYFSYILAMSFTPESKAKVKLLLKEIGYKKQKNWRFLKDVTDRHWVKLDLGLHGWTCRETVTLFGEVGDRRVSRIATQTVSTPRPTADPDHDYGFSVIPGRGDAGRKCLGIDTRKRNSYVNDEIDIYLSDIRLMDQFLVANANDESFSSLLRNGPDQQLIRISKSVLTGDIEAAWQEFERNRNNLSNSRPYLETFLREQTR